MKLAGWLAIAVALLLWGVALVGVADDAHQAGNGGRDITEIDHNNNIWMAEGIGGAVFLVAGIALIASVGRSPASSTALEAPASPQQSQTLQEPKVLSSRQIDDYTLEDEIQQRFGDRLERSFFTTVAGVTFSNDDGSNRMEAVLDCEPGEKLVLRSNTNKQYPDSVAVFSPRKAQLGYLAKRLAHQVHGDPKDGDYVWHCYFADVSRVDDVGPPVGARILMARVEKKI